MRENKYTNRGNSKLRYLQPAVFKEDWRELRPSMHVLKDRKLRWMGMSQDAEILMALKQLNVVKYMLFLDNGYKLIVTHETVITVLTPEMDMSIYDTILWDRPYVRHDEDWYLT